MSADMDHTDKVVTLIEECKHLGLTVLPPDVNESFYEFTVADDRTIRYGLGAIKGVGEGAVQALIGERQARGAFLNLEALCRRLDLSKVNRRVFEAISSGALLFAGAAASAGGVLAGRGLVSRSSAARAVSSSSSVTVGVGTGAAGSKIRSTKWRSIAVSSAFGGAFLAACGVGLAADAAAGAGVAAFALLG